MAVLLSGTTIGGHVAVHANNISTYALTSIPATISPTNIYVGNAIYFGGANNYFNWDGARINSNVGIQSTSDMRAPIFYDSNDTSFYLDPNAGKSLRIAGGIEQNNLVGRPFAQWGQGGAATGAVVIKFPGNADNYGMVHAVVDIYEYNGSNVCTIIIGGHNWGSRWYSYGANMVGFTDKPVRVAFKDGKYAIVIGNDSSSWSYGQVVLRKIQNGSYYAGVMDVASGYTVGIEPESSTWISEDLRGLRVGGPVSATNISTGVNASHIVQRDVNGYIYANHINFSTSESENPTISSFITSNGDGWSRKSSLAHVRNQLGNYGNWITTDGRAYPRRSDGTAINFWWDGQGGQPTWLWGSNNGVDFYVWNPSNFSVNYATTAGSAPANGGTSTHTYRGIIEDTRAAQRTPNAYEDYRVSWEFTNQMPHDSNWLSVMTMQGWHDGYAAWQIMGTATTTAFENWYLRSGVNGTWNTARTIIHSGNIGSQSVNYATSAGNSVSTDQTNFSALFIEDAPVATKEYVTSQGYLTSLPAHNHDDRYYTESESDGRFFYAISSQLANTNLNDLTTRGVYYSADQYGTNSNIPFANYFTMINLTNDSARQAQLWFGDTPGRAYWRPRQGDAIWHPWEQLITSNNIGSQSVSYASSAGNADTLDGLNSSVFVRNDVYNSADAGLQVFRNIGSIDGSWPSSDHTFGLENSDAGTIVINFHRAGYTSNNLWYNGSQFRFDQVVTSTADFRAPIFYDSNNTNYYGDFAATSRFSRLLVQQAGVNSTAGPALRVSKGWDNGTPDIIYDTVVIESNDVTTIRMKEADGGTAGWSTGDGNTSFTSNVPMRFYTGGNESSYIYSGQGGTLAMYISNDQKVGIGTSDFSYATGDNTPVVGSGHTTNKLYVNGSIQLLSNDDAIVIGRGTATFLKDEEIGFGWGGGWYMTEGSYIRSRAGKSLHMNGGSVDYVGSLYLEGSVGVHLQPNAGSYGSLQVTGSKDGWHGVRFTGSNVVVMANTNEVGFHNNNAGWQFLWSAGTAYVYKGGTGGGTQATVLDTANAFYAWNMNQYVRTTDSVSFNQTTTSNSYTGNYFQVESSRAVNEFGHVGMFRSRQYSETNYIPFSFQSQYGTHSWGQVARFHIEQAGADRPSIQFSSGTNNTRWNIGYCTGSDDHFRITQNMGHRPDMSGANDGWGTERFKIDGNGAVYVPNIIYTNEINHANGRIYLPGNMHIDTYNGNDIYMNYYSARGTRIYVGSGTLALHVNTDGLVYMPTVVVNSHSDNTKGYRIHNTSGTTVSAMFVNSSNQLVIAAGAVDQVNLNKKVLVNGVALGVNVAPSATAGRIDASNDIVAYSSSDERLKENIAPIENALDKVKSLTGVEFDWKPEYKHAHGYEGHDTGVIAQQVEAVMPSAVRTNDTGFLAVRYEKLIGLLIEGMKEQQVQIDELKAKLDGLTK